ncbi:response regulator transcription factor [Shouchella shacheensis]|uniref:response regulator transcription factor n=1 Tax=Shouchella shacheensis TaxID=1649580 RepID=UPI00073FF7FF|nr:response regulator transcription factor [Shouchella shacheensis]
MYHIYLVEDDTQIGRILADHLSKHGYEVTQTKDFANVKSEFTQLAPDLVLLDINLPHFDGFYWCRQIRTDSNVPVLFISARTDEMNQVMAIENGGDDYITKPFHLDVVLAKVKSSLRRTYGEYAGSKEIHQNVHELAELFSYPDRNEIVFSERRLELTKKEFLLFQRLADRHDRIVSRDDLLEALWDEVDFVDDNTLSVNVTRLRKRLADVGIVDAIQTIRGQGYRLNVNWKDTNS